MGGRIGGDERVEEGGGEVTGGGIKRLDEGEGLGVAKDEDRVGVDKEEESERTPSSTDASSGFFEFCGNSGGGNEGNEAVVDPAAPLR